MNSSTDYNELQQNDKHELSKRLFYDAINVGL